MIGVAAYQVVLRNLFDSGLIFGDALVRVMVLWVAMFGAMVASRQDQHIRIDLLERLAPTAWANALRRVTAAFTAFVLGVFAWSSGQFVLEEYEYEVIAFAQVPAWVCEAVMPFGAAVMALRYVLHVFVLPPREEQDA